MAFTDRRPDSHRTAKLIAVSAIHAAVIYGLVVGLAVSFVKTDPVIFKTKNYPVEPPPPIPPKPEPTKTREVAERVQPERLPVSGPLQIRNIPSDPIPLPIDNLIVLPTPTPSASPNPLPSFSARQASPRNNPGLWVTTNDYPTADIREGNEGTVRFALSIDADGKVQGCDILQSSGHPRLDAATCSKVSRRARFEPATGTAGEKVPGTYINTVRGVIPED